MSLKENRYTSVYDADYQSPFTYPGLIDKIVFDMKEWRGSTFEEIKKGLHTE